MKNQKTGGRTAGTPNRTTKDFREQINSFLDKNWPKVQHDFDAMEPKDKLLFIEKLLKYTLPTLSSVAVDYERLSDAQLDLLIDKLLQRS